MGFSGEPTMETFSAHIRIYFFHSSHTQLSRYRYNSATNTPAVEGLRDRAAIHVSKTQKTSQAVA